MSRTLLVVGGYGTLGSRLVEMLLRFTDDRVIIGGRNAARARRLADRLSDRYRGRVDARGLDVADREALIAGFTEADFIFMASSTPQHASLVAEVAIETERDFLDCQLSEAKLESLKLFDPVAQRAGRVFITDGGFHPGLPAAMLRHLRPRFDRMREGHVGSVIRQDYRDVHLSESTWSEMVELIRHYHARVLDDGKWKDHGWNSKLAMRRFDFGGEFGVQNCAAMGLQELEDLGAEIPEMERGGFYVAGFDAFTSYVAMPSAALMVKMGSDKPAAHLLEWSLKHFGHPPYGTLLVAEAIGVREGRPFTETMRVGPADAYALTAAPMVATYFQWRDRALARGRGVVTQAMAVNPARLFADLPELGIRVVDGPAGAARIRML